MFDRVADHNMSRGRYRALTALMLALAGAWAGTVVVLWLVSQ